MAEWIPLAWRETLDRLGIGPELLAVAMAFSQTPQELDREDRRALALLALMVLMAARDGHTRLPLSGPGADETAALAATLAGPGVDLQGLLARPSLGIAWGPAGSGKPLIFGEGAGGESWLTTLRLYHAEERIAHAVLTRLGPLPGTGQERSSASEPPLLEALVSLPVALSHEQREAVRRAVTSALTLITGGPGTGKTSIVVAILRAAAHAGIPPSDIALTAPTGKAAQRLGESLRGTLARLSAPDPADQDLLDHLPEPQTLHRMLAYLPSRGAFRHHRHNPLPFRLVVVDESSMVGLELMDGLLLAMPPGAQLVLLGDAEQLPSVEAGAVFRDLVASLPAATVRLTHSYRMDVGDPDGRSVLGTALALREGRDADLEGPGLLAVRSDLSLLQGHGAEAVDLDHATLGTFLDDWMALEILGQTGFQEAAARIYEPGPEGWAQGDVEALGILFQTFERARILCPLRVGGGLRGVEALNLYLHARLQASTHVPLDRDLSFYAGEPVMVRANDYRHGLFNGDQGVVVKAREADGIHQRVVFRTQIGFRGLGLRALRGQLEWAYALTVHKAQGSEFDRIALVLPDHAGRLLTREVVYTALTRARRSATILGTRASLTAASKATTFRSTGLADHLA